MKLTDINPFEIVFQLIMELVYILNWFWFSEPNVAKLPINTVLTCFYCVYIVLPGN